jgi:ABC-type antimicrobial peptide transport system permease subunit
MYETSFSVNDLLRRRTQTSLAVICLTLSVASTLFLLLFSSRIGIGITSVSEGVLTGDLSLIFSQFIRFVGILIFAVGAVLTSFMVFLMMNQRTRDFGLIKAAGCPNDLLFGYYMTELLILTLASCTLGIVIGLVADHASSSLSSFSVYHNPPNLWFTPLVFVAFFVLAIVFGAKPLLNAAQLSPLNALSPVQYYGLTAGAKAKPFTKSRLTAKVALRSLFRRKTASVRIVLLLSIVFILLTVSIAGSIIAKETTISWIQKASGQNVVAIAHETMATQYRRLQSAFIGTAENGEFNYTDQQLAIPNDVIQQLRAEAGIIKVDARLILKEHIHEIANFTIDPDTLATIPVGDNRDGDSIVIGVEPDNLTSKWFMQGRFLNDEDRSNVVIGDSIAKTMLSLPLVQSIRMLNQQFAIVGVCIDPINNGRVVYVPLKKLQDTAGLSLPNIVFAALDPSIDRATLMDEITRIAKNSGSDLMVFELSGTIEENISFLDSTWSTIMLLPLLTLSSAALCLVAYVMLAIDEQRQEFGFLRAVGAKPKTITHIVAIQSVIVLLSSLGFGLSLGTITTLLILMRQPVVTSFTIVEIAAWLFAALAGMFLLSLLPAFKLAKTPLLKILA